MAIALIGGVLKEDNSECMWSEVSEELMKSQFHLHTDNEDLNYQHPTLRASIDLRYQFTYLHACAW